jgi:hypothetical protein
MRSVLVVLGVAVLAAPARADDETAITWTAPAGCPAADVVRERVIANLGRPLRDGEVGATLAVRKKGRRWKVTMTVRLGEAPAGVRTLEAGSCAELAESTALILALTIDPYAGEADPLAGDPVGEPEMIEIFEPAVAERAEDEEIPPVPDLTRVHVDASEREPRPPMPVVIRARALVGGDLGSLPGTASGWGAAAEVAIGPWSIDAGLQSFAEQRTELSGSMPEVGAIIGLTSVDVRGCYTGGRRPWRAGGCIGADAAVTRSVGFGFDVPEPRSTVGGGLQFGAMWAVRVVGPVGIRADVTATWQLARTVLTTGDGEIIHDPELLVWRGFAGVEAAWP